MLLLLLPPLSLCYYCTTIPPFYHGHAYMQVHTCVHRCVSVCACMCMVTQVHRYIGMLRILTYSHAYILTHLHTHICTHAAPTPGGPWLPHSLPHTARESVSGKAAAGRCSRGCPCRRASLVRHCPRGWSCRTRAPSCKRPRPPIG